MLDAFCLHLAFILFYCAPQVATCAAQARVVGHVHPVTSNACLGVFHLKEYNQLSEQRLRPIPGMSMLLALVDQPAVKAGDEIPRAHRRKAVMLINVGLAAAFRVKPLSSITQRFFSEHATRSINYRAKHASIHGPIRIDSSHFEAGADCIYVIGTVTCREHHFAFSSEVTFDETGAARVRTLRVA